MGTAGGPEAPVVWSMTFGSAVEKGWGADSLRAAVDDLGLTGMTRLCLLVIQFACCNGVMAGMIYSILWLLIGGSRGPR
jgi:hypothetical protein